MGKIETILGSIVFFISSCAVLGTLTYVPERRIREGFNQLFDTAQLTTTGVVLLAGGLTSLLLVAVFIYIGHVLFNSGVIWRSTARIRNAEALKAEREAKFMVTDHAPGSQVYVHKMRDIDMTSTPVYLASGSVNGGGLEPKVAEWQLFNMAHSIASSPRNITIEGQGVPQLPEGNTIRPILPLLVNAQRLIISGGSDSGKTTVAKHLIAARSDHSKIIVIDPHSPSKILGYDVIGAGREYGQIGEALESLVLLMHERYRDVATGAAGYLSHERCSVFIDEWTSIAEEVKEAGRWLKVLLTESRKVNIHLTLLVHSTTVPVLGLPDAQIKRSATIVELVGGNDGSPHRAFVQPNSRTTPDGKRATPVEFALPGPFTGWPEPSGEVVLQLPDPKTIKVRKMADDGKSPTAIARELFGVEKANKRQIDHVNSILGG